MTVSEPRVVCVLSGGGAKAAAHVGALKALEERGLTVSHFVGTSIGAVIAACYASGLTYRQMLVKVTGLTSGAVARPSAGLLLGPLAQSILSDAPLRRTIGDLVPVRRFADLVIPLTVTAVDTRNGDLVVFGDGGRARVPLLDALYASCALPVYYPPASIGDRQYVDGGLRSVLALDLAFRFDPDLVVAVNVGPSRYAEPSEEGIPIPPMLRAHDRAMRILMGSQTEREVARWRDGPVPVILVEPYRHHAATFDVSGAVRYVEEGYRAAVRAMRDPTVARPLAALQEGRD